jgi:hypothetical protein
MTLTEVLLAEAEANYAITESLFRRVADDELPWTPATGQSWMTVGQLLMHCASFGCVRPFGGCRGDWGLPQVQCRRPDSRSPRPPPAALPSVARCQQALELLADDRDLTVAITVTSKKATCWRESSSALGRSGAYAVPAPAAHDCPSRAAQGPAVLLPQADGQKDVEDRSICGN